MKSFFRPLFLCVSVLVVGSITGCNSQKGSNADEQVSSPANFSQYIAGYTGGLVSRATPITVKFSKTVPGAKAGETLASDMLDITPSVSGKVVWEDDHTAVFTPEQWLESDNDYHITLHVQELFPDIADDLKDFKFKIHTIPFHLVVGQAGIVPDSTEREDFLAVKAEVQTSDVVKLEQLKKALSAQIEGKTLPMKITAAPGNQRFQVLVSNAERGNQEQNLTLEWHWPDNEKEQGKLNLQIPAKGVFKLMSMELVQDNETYFELRFSDPLSEEQLLDHFVSLPNMKFKTVALGNVLKLYPQEKLSGSAVVKVMEGLKNYKGKTLGKAYQQTFQISTLKPNVDFVQTKGNILPQKNQLYVPIEVTNLRALRIEVVQIFEDNIDQYFQDNDWGGTYHLERVGRPVVREVLPLKQLGITHFNGKHKLTLDLAKIFDLSPGAFYQVKLSFDQNFAVYPCGEIEDQKPIETQKIIGPNMDWDSQGTDYSNYNWRERDNPCDPTYYMEHEGVSKMFFASSIGMISKGGDNNSLTIISSDLNTVAPLKGVHLKVYDYQHQLMAEENTDKEGMAHFDLPRKAFFVVGEKDKEYAYLKLEDGEALSTSNFDVGGSQVKSGMKGFIYGERGVWRPGDTLNLSFILAKHGDALPDGQPLLMELYTPLGQKYKTFQPIGQAGNIYRFAPHTDKDAPTGTWRCKLLVGGATFTKAIKIETVKPNRLKVTWENDAPMLYAGEISRLPIAVKWLHGAVANGLRAKYEANLRNAHTTFEGYGAYDFSDESKTFEQDQKVVLDERLNSNGEAQIPAQFDIGHKAPGFISVAYNGKIFEEGGDFSIDYHKVIYSPYKSYVGLKMPESDYGEPVLYADRVNGVPIVTLDQKGNPVSRQNLQVKLYKLDWRWWWDNSYDDISNYVNSTYHDPIYTRQVSTTNGKGTLKMNFNRSEWGRFYLQVKDPVSGHSTGAVFFLQDRNGFDNALSGATMLSFSMDKREAKVGENVTLKIPGQAGSKALVSFENGSRVIASQWVNLQDGQTEWSFPITHDMAPNVYVNVMVLQPHGQVKNDLPLRLYGVKNLMVTDPDTKLTPELKMADNAQPEKPLTIKVKEKDGKPMAYTLAIVDEGLLGLTNFHTPNPWDNFYAREALGVRTWDMYDQVIGTYAGQLGPLWSVGGDEGLKPNLKPDVNRFKPVVQYLGPFMLKKGKTASHTIQLPSYVGELRVMVVAAGEDRYGSAEKSVTVSQPLMLLATLPRVAGPGESIKVPVQLFTKDAIKKPIKVQIKADGMLAVDGTASLSTAPKGSEQMVYFNLKAKQAVGAAHIQLIASSGSHKAHYEVEMAVRPSNPVMTKVDTKLLKPGASITMPYQPTGMAGTNDASVEVSSMPPLNLQQRMEYLIHYPHGCVEQTTSTALAQLMLPKLQKLSEEDAAAIDNNVKTAIQRLQRFQIANGGLGYWPGSRWVSEWGTNYALHFLLLAQKAGYQVPSSFLNGILRYQKQQANQWSYDPRYGYELQSQAYRLYTLALALQPDLAAMNRLRERSNLPTMALWQLADAYAVGGYKDEAKNLIQSVKPVADTPQEWWEVNFGSTTRDQAIILSTQTHTGQQEAAFTTLQKIANVLGDTDHWLSTQTIGYSLMAIAQYAENNPTAGGMKASISQKGQAAHAINSQAYMASQPLSHPDQAGSVEIQNSSQGMLYVRLLKTGVPIQGAEEAFSRGLTLQVDYYDKNDQPLDPSDIKQGTDFKAIVTVANTNTGNTIKNLALSQIFPSGWEILNDRLQEGESDKEQTYTYRDIRDDRVYTYFDLNPNRSKTFTVMLNASYAGHFYLPGVSVEAMYDHQVAAAHEGQWVEVKQ